MNDEHRTPAEGPEPDPGESAAANNAPAVPEASSSSKPSGVGSKAGSGEGGSGGDAVSTDGCSEADESDLGDDCAVADEPAGADGSSESEGGRSGGDVGFGGVDHEGLVDGMIQLGSLENATRAELVRWLAEFCRREGWVPEGHRGLVGYLRMAHGCTTTTAHQFKIVVEAYLELPLLHQTFASGGCSWDQYVAASELATSTTDAYWAQEVTERSAEDLRRLVVVKHKVERLAGEDLSPTLRIRHGATNNLVGSFQPDQVAQIKGCLDEIADQVCPRNAETGERPPIEIRRGLALAWLTGIETDLERAQVRPSTVVGHVTLAELGADTAADAVGLLASGEAVSMHTIRRMACGGRFELAVDAADGTTLGVGRATRTWPGWLGRKIRHRDSDQCRYPGCGGRADHLHHIVFWSNNGETSTSNGISLCFHHHHLVHEGGCVVDGNADGTVTFTTRWGRKHQSTPARPPPIAPQVNQLFNELKPTRRSTNGPTRGRTLGSDPTHDSGPADPPNRQPKLQRGRGRTRGPTNASGPEPQPPTEPGLPTT